MKALILLIVFAVMGTALIVTGGITGYTILEACPQPGFVYLNNLSLSEVNESVIQQVNKYFNATPSRVRSFTSDKEYYLVELIKGATIRECVTDLETTCGCQENSYN